MKNRLTILLFIIIILVILGVVVTLRNTINSTNNNRIVTNNSYFQNTDSKYIEYTPVDSEYSAKNISKMNLDFCEGEEVLPTKIYLTTSTYSNLEGEPTYIKLDGSSYKIEKEICQYEDEERIAYGEELVIYRNIPSILFNNRNVSYVVPDSAGAYEEDLASLFRGYFATGNNDLIYRAFKTNLDNDPTTNEISFISYIDNKLSRFFSIEVGTETKTYSAPVYIGNKIEGKDNLYYINKSYSNYSLNEIINNCNIPFGYIKFTPDNSFVEEHKLLDEKTNVADSLSIFTGIMFTLSKDINIKPYPIDGLLNNESENLDDKIEYYFTKGTSENKLTKGTKFIVERILDDNGNGIIRTEDGTLYLLGNN